LGALSLDYSDYDKYIVKTDLVITFGVLVFYFAIYRLPLGQTAKFGWSVGMAFAIILYVVLKHYFSKTGKHYKVIPTNHSVTSLALISEDRKILKEWNLYGKVGLLIGKNSGENEVDIDLAFTSEAPFISKQHAILNYVEGHWYIEDVGSKNGLEIKKSDQDTIYKLTELKPIRLDRGDIILINETALLLR
jgi:hypothetical protein